MEIKFAGLVIGLVILQVRAELAEESWQKPSAWSDRRTEVSNCPVRDANDDSVIASYLYKKLISFIFNKKFLKENETTGQLERAILFSLSPDQLVHLENIKDLRDVDNIVNIILATATVYDVPAPSRDYTSFVWIIPATVKYIWHLLTIVLANSEARFMLLVTVVLMVLYLIRKRYNKNFIFLIAISLFLFGYFHTYFECNRKIEADRIIEFIKSNEDEGYFSKLYNSIFGTSNVDKSIKDIRRKSKLNWSFCRPDHVLLMYVNEMFLDEIQFIIEKLMDIMVSLTSKLSYGQAIVAVVVLPFFTYYVLALVFKYIFNPVVWYRIYRDNYNRSEEKYIRQEDANTDRISGQNLEKLIDLALQNSNNKRLLEGVSSGVEELMQAISPPPEEKKEDVSSTELQSLEAETESKKNN